MSSLFLPDAPVCYVILSKDPKYRENLIFKWKLQKCEPYLLEHDSLRCFVIVMCCCGGLKKNGPRREPLGGNGFVRRKHITVEIGFKYSHILKSWPTSPPVVFRSFCISLNTFSSTMPACTLSCPIMTIMMSYTPTQLNVFLYTWSWRISTTI